MAETPTTTDRRPKTDAARQRQRDGQYKGLLHAAQKRKADNSANYAPAFAHGQMAPDFEHSAEAAGESREEVRGHLSLLDRTLLTLSGFFPRLGKAQSGGASGLISDGHAPRLPIHTDVSSPRVQAGARLGAAALASAAALPHPGELGAVGHLPSLAAGGALAARARRFNGGAAGGVSRASAGPWPSTTTPAWAD